MVKHELTDVTDHKITYGPTKIAKGVERRYLLPDLRRRRNSMKRGVKRMNVSEIVAQHMKKIMEDNPLTAESVEEMTGQKIRESQLERAQARLQKQEDRLDAKIEKMAEKAKERAKRREERKKQRDAEKAKGEKSTAKKSTSKAKSAGKSSTAKKSTGGTKKTATKKTSTKKATTSKKKK